MISLLGFCFLANVVVVNKASKFDGNQSKLSKKGKGAEDEGEADVS